ASFPLAEKLEKSFGFDVQLFQIAVPERLGLDVVALGEQEQIVSARQQAVHEATAKIRQDTEAFVADCVSTLREQTAQLCSDMLHSIQTGETGVHQKTLNRLIRFIEQFKQMNFANDAEMEQQLENVRKELLSKTAEEYRDSATARQRLVEGLGRLGEQARVLAQADATALNKQPDGSYGLTADLWDGHVERELGKGYGKLLQLYGVHKAMREARKKGYLVQRKAQQDGAIKLVIAGI